VATVYSASTHTHTHTHTRARARARAQMDLFLYQPYRKLWQQLLTKEIAGVKVSEYEMLR